MLPPAIPDLIVQKIAEAVWRRPELDRLREPIAAKSECAFSSHARSCYFLALRNWRMRPFGENEFNFSF